MTNSTFPFGGTFVSGLGGRDERGTFTGTRATDSVGTYTGAPITGRLGRFTEADTARSALRGPGCAPAGRPRVRDARMDA